MSTQFAGLYTVDVQKVWNGEYWTNVYHVDATGIADALSKGIEIANIEKAVLATDVTITAVRARPTGVVGGETAFSAVNIIGTLTTTGNVPLEVCVRVVFGNSTSRPGIKYLRAAVSSTDFATRKTLAAGRLTAVDTNYSTPIMAKTYLRDARGRAVLTVKANAQTSNHQLRRGSKRKAKAIITP